MRYLGCVCLRQEMAAKLHCIVAITANLSAPNLTFTDWPFHQQPSATLCAAPLLRNCRAAPRFNPTRSFDWAQDRFIIRYYFGDISAI
jgi:hypothetical protein